MYLLVSGDLWWPPVLWFPMREKITKYLFFPLKPKIVTKSFCAAAICCTQSRRPAAGRPAVVYEYIRWQLLQIKAIKLGDSLWIQWEI